MLALILSLIFSGGGAKAWAQNNKGFVNEDKQAKFKEIRQIIALKRVAEESKIAAGTGVEVYIKGALQAKMNSQTTLGQAASLEKAKTEMVATFNQCLNTQDLVEKLVPIYDRHFTQAEIHWLTQFYQTSLGQKELTAGVPQQMREDYKSAVQDWVRAAGVQFAARLQGMKDRLPASAGGAKKPATNSDQYY